MKRQNPPSGLPITSAHLIVRFRFLATAILTLVSLFALGTWSVAAQSGRRSVKPPATPTPSPTPEPTPSETKSTEKDKVALTLIVGMDAPDNFAYVPAYLYDGVLQSCAQRLDQARSVKVDIQRNMNRGDATKRAKAEKESPVVFLRLRADNVSASSSSSTADLSQVYIEYVVFAPETAKILTSGSAYQGINKGVINVPVGRQGAATAEFRLKQAARDAAERILSALHLGAPRTQPF